MFALHFDFGPGVILCLVLLIVFSLRLKVTPRAWAVAQVPPAKLWALLKPYDGKIDNWGRTQVVARLRSAESQSYEITYSTTQSNGTVRVFSAHFKLAVAEDNHLLVLQREGLEGKKTDNELLEIRHQLDAQGTGTRLTTTYKWGRRPMLAQLLARADLWGGVYRLKGLAETGKPNDRAYWLINFVMAVVTAGISIAAFNVFMIWQMSAVLILALLVHEFGHLLAFRLMGQPWGRMVFLPFLGAVAVPRLPYESQGQSVFAALMGPGFSVLLAAICLLPTYLGWQSAILFVAVGTMVAALNAFNMLPAEPLDGGVALRSILGRIVGGKAWAALMAVGGILIAFGLAIGQVAFIIFGVIAVLANVRRRKIDANLIPLSSLQLCIAFFGYIAIAGAHLTMMNWFLRHLGI